MKRYAFTLIELLVVIGIIALLISILLPVLGSVRETAKQSVCASNIRQIGVASTVFAVDSKGRLPPHSSNASGNKTSWCLAEVSGYTPEEGFSESLLGPYLSEVTQIGGCPTWDPPREYVTALSAFRGINFPEIDYGYNGKMLGITTKTPTGLNNGALWIGFRISQLQDATSTILFADAGIYAPGVDGNIGFAEEYEIEPPVNDPLPARNMPNKVGPNSNRTSVHARHTGLANTAWADGHVSAETVRFEEADANETEAGIGDLFEGAAANNDWWDGGIR